MQLGNNDRVLLATVRALMFPAKGVEVLREGHDAFAGWMKHRHALVIADFGALSDGMTGPRLARAIRMRCKSTHICLMSDEPRPDQAQWALAQGADELIPRTREAILDRLPSEVPSEAVAWQPSDFPQEEALDDMASRVAHELNEAGLGPAAALAVDDAMRALLVRRRGIPPAAKDVACEVGMEISDLEARRRFLRKFGVQ